jgi:hypothetical protein
MKVTCTVIGTGTIQQTQQKSTQHYSFFLVLFLVSHQTVRAIILNASQQQVSHYEVLIYY